MFKRVIKRIGLEFPYYHEIEEDLKKYAAEGLILEKMGATFWTFRKDEPQELKYQISFFVEGSEFEPNLTVNQETYLEYAKEGGWDFVCSFDRMHIFSSSLDNPIPFETDEAGMLDNLENLHRYMGKTLVTPNLCQAGIWGVYLLMMTRFFIQSPMSLLEHNLAIALMFLVVTTILMTLNTVIDYYKMYHQSKKALELGLENEIVRNKKNKIKNRIFQGIAIISVVVMYWELAKGIGTTVAMLTLFQVPLFIIVLNVMKKLMKRLQLSERKNKIISHTVTALLACIYVALTSYIMLSNRTLDVAEEIVVEQSIFIKTVEQRETIEFADGSSQEIYYETYTSNLDIVMHLKKEDLLEKAEWIYIGVIEIDNTIFGTQEAYQVINTESGQEIGTYILIYQDKIIQLELDTLVEDTQLQELPAIIT